MENVIMNSGGIFNNTYTVEYDDASNQDGHECIVTNTLETIDQVAAIKNWENEDEFTKNVIFEIKYLKKMEIKTILTIGIHLIQRLKLY